MAGTLFVVATPIGNLGDMTFRAKAVLGSVSIIACEDTRVTGRLLHHFDIHTKVISYHEHNESARAPDLIARLSRGESVALVSDAGTPLVSDPGYRLVRAARKEGIPVRPIPGASAPIAALSVAGLPSSNVTFAGFLPGRGGARRKALEALGKTPGTIVLFESPERITRLLEDLAALLGPRPATLLREMTKLHEEHREGSLPELEEWVTSRRAKLKGEITLVVGPAAKAPRTVFDAASFDALAPRFAELRREGLSAKEAAKRLAKEQGVSARTVYNELHARKG